MNQLISNQPNIVSEPVTVVEKTFDHDKLLSALYWCYDVFERANMLFFPVYKTGRQVKDNELLTGTNIDIGVRRLEWESGGKRILDAFVEQQAMPEKDEETKVTYQYEGVPVIVHIFEDDPMFSSCDTVMYHMEDFKLPNPYEKFEKIYG